MKRFIAPSLLFLFLCVFAYFNATLSFKYKSYDQLQNTLPRALEQADLYHLGDASVFEHIALTLNDDLKQLCRSTFLSLLAECHARVLRYRSKGFSEAPARFEVNIYSVGREKPSLVLGLYYDMNWLALLGVQGLISIAAAAVFFLVPSPVSRRRLMWITRLKNQGVSFGKAYRLSASVDKLTEEQEHLLELVEANFKERLALGLGLLSDSRFCNLNAEQARWFSLILQNKSTSAEQALQIAVAPPRLKFYCDTKILEIHGTRVEISSTPFFYYLWYAMLRKDSIDSGWFTNPASNQGSKAHGKKLAELIRLHDGHGKAARDLEEKGLRAKVLDQNRSKIKDELVQVLGEQLAAPYLFESERDLRISRKRYRLISPPEAIEVHALSYSLNDEIAKMQEIAV